MGDKMKAEYLNPIIFSLVNVLQNSAQLEPKKGSLYKEDTLNTEKEYTVILNFVGDIEGFFAFGFEKNVALSIVNNMTGGMATGDEIDELGESVLMEIASMVQGNAVGELFTKGYKVNVESINLFSKQDLPLYPPETTLKSIIETNTGEIEMNISLYKK